MFRFASALLALALLAGCSSTPPRGIVVKKNHRGAWTQFVPMRIGKSTFIMPIRHPPQCDLVVQADGTRDDQGQFLVVVTRGAWDAIEVGDVWERPDTVHQDMSQR